MANSTGITITFQKSCGVGECAARAFEVDPDGTIEPGQRVTFRVYGAMANAVSNLTLFNSTRPLSGSFYIRQWDQTYTEIVSFSGTDKVQLKYPVSSSSGMVIIAQTDVMKADKNTNALSLYAPGGARLTSKMSLVGYSCVGVLESAYNYYGSVKVSYTIARNIKAWRWTAPNRSGDYYFYLTDADGILLFTQKITIDASETEDAAPIDVVAVIKEYASNCPVEGATVYIDGSLLLTQTDENGSVNCGTLSAGRHTIKIVKTGYVNSDEDDLENDSFVIGAA